MEEIKKQIKELEKMLEKAVRNWYWAEAQQRIYEQLEVLHNKLKTYD